MNIVILGATRGMGRSLARLYGGQGDHLFLLGRNWEQLKRSAEDIGIRAGIDPPGFSWCDLAQPHSFAPALDAAEKRLSTINTVIVTAGLFATQENLESDPRLLEEVLTANFTGTILFCEEARRRLLSNKNGGTLCVFSSVAGERARKPVALYGATKAGLSHYLEGLDHKYRRRRLRTICVKPGFIKTGMTSGLKPPPFAGRPDAVAKAVSKAIAKGKPVLFTPGPWRFVMFVIRNLPRWVMRRIRF